MRLAAATPRVCAEREFDRATNPSALTKRGSHAAMTLCPPDRSHEDLRMSPYLNSSFGRRVFVKVTTALGAAAVLAPIAGLGRAARAAGSDVGEVTKLRGQAR